MDGIRRFAACLLMVAGLTAGQAFAELSREELVELFPALEVSQIADSPLPGFFEIRSGTDVAYISKDGRYLLQGEVIDLEAQVSLTQRRQESLRAEALAEVEDAEMIVFSPEQPLHTVTVFTDIDCGFCRQMHAEMDQLLALGIRVQYLFYPRSGPETESWDKARNVWCASDRHDAITRAKLGERLPDLECVPNPVGEHFQLGRDVGLRGTPMVVAANGRELGGYLSPQELLSRLEMLASE